MKKCPIIALGSKLPSKNIFAFCNFIKENIKESFNIKGLLTSLIAILFFASMSASTFAADLTPTLGDNSAYTLTEVSSAGADTISYKEYDSVSGTYVTKYYKITLKTANLGQHLSWSESSTGSTGSIVITLPNGTAKTYYYTYTTPSGYTQTSTRLTSIRAAAVANKVFKGANSTDNGGAIYNTGNNSTINITSDFVGNYVQTSNDRYGGAIYNTSYLGNITGDFTGNYVYYTGSSHRYYSYGGAIYNTGTIGDITGDFTGNFVQTSRTYGGAIYNTGTIGDITGNFVGNYADSKYY